jgi:hypothetical protein
MAWIKIKNRSYYYHTIYIGGKYFNLYCGGGARGAAFERLFARLRDEKRCERANRSGQADTTAPTDGPPAG